MLFTVTYRSNTGAKTEVEIEAASRAACVAECKSRGVAPMAIREGRASSRSRAAETAAPHDGGANTGTLWRAAILAAAILAVIGGGAWWWIAARPASTPSQKEEPVKQKAEKPPVQPKPTTQLKPTTQPNSAAKPVITNAVSMAQEEPLQPWNDSFMTNREMRLKYSTLFQATTNEGGLVIERYRLPNGKTWRKIIEPPPVFSNICDQAIAMVMAGAAGAPIPPVPGLDSANLDAEFLKSLEVPIRIDPDDPPRIAALKLAVKDTRDEIVRLKAEGDKRTVGQMLSEHIKANNRNAEMQAEALRAIEDVRRKDGDEMAEEYLKAVNENLKSYGVSPVSIGKRRAPQPKR